MSKVLVPAIHLLQHRTNNKCDPGNRDAELLETVRGRWCALLETPMPADKHEHWSTVFNKVVPDDNSGCWTYVFFGQLIFTMSNFLSCLAMRGGLHFCSTLKP